MRVYSTFSLAVFPEYDPLPGRNYFQIYAVENEGGGEEDGERIFSSVSRQSEVVVVR